MSTTNVVPTTVLTTLISYSTVPTTILTTNTQTVSTTEIDTVDEYFTSYSTETDTTTATSTQTVVSTTATTTTQTEDFSFTTTTTAPPTTTTVSTTVTYLTAQGAPSLYPNQIENPSFETGDMTGWLLQNQTSGSYTKSNLLSTANPHTGEYSMYVPNTYNSCPTC